MCDTVIECGGQRARGVKAQSKEGDATNFNGKVHGISRFEEKGQFPIGFVGLKYKFSNYMDILSRQMDSIWLRSQEKSVT